jgi:mycofactocin system glycosyltransferase
MRFTVDSTWRRPLEGDVVIAGSPLRIFTLTKAGRTVAERIEKGLEISQSAAVLVEKFVDAGAVHPLADTDSSSTPGIDDITAVIPAHLTETKDVDQLLHLIEQLDGVAEIIVVDDTSPLSVPPIELPSVKVLRRAVNGGPGAARNTGLAEVRTNHVVFIDADVECTAHDVASLARWWIHPRTALLAPRVRTREWFTDRSMIAAYEAARSALDMGDAPARVRAGSRVSYVPAAMLLCSVDAVREAGGFDESLRTGEDVDLVWRLDRAGHLCRYEPAVEVFHRPRASLGEFARQRHGYGRSAAGLADEHGNAVSPLRVSWWSAGVWASLLAGLPALAAGLSVTTIVLLARKLRFVPSATKEAARLAGLGHVHAGKFLAGAITRVWWPIAVLLALVSKRARVALIAAVMAPAAFEWVTKKPNIDPVRYTAMRVLDDVAYGSGVWRGVVERRNLGPVTPDVTSWPSNARP